MGGQSSPHPPLKVGDRVMFMVKEPEKSHYFGLRWTDLDCANGTVKQLKKTEIQFKLDSGLLVTLSLKELEEVILYSVPANPSTE